MLTGFGSSGSNGLGTSKCTEGYVVEIPRLKQENKYLKKVALVMWGMFIVCLFLLVVKDCHAATDITVDTRATYMIHQDRKVKGNVGLEARVGWKNVYLFASQDPTQIYGSWFPIQGFGVGLQVKPVKWLNVWIQGGRFFPQSEGTFFGDEGLYYQQLDALGLTYQQRAWRHYSVSWDSAYGGEAGIDIQKHLWKGLSVGISGSYRALKMSELIKGWDDDKLGSDSGWWIGTQRDFSGARIMMFIKYEW